MRKKKTPRPARLDDLDVAVMIDATLDQAHLSTAFDVARHILPYAGRSALVMYADHEECQRAPSHTGSSGMAPLPPYAVKSKAFSPNADEQLEWLQQATNRVPTPYMDGALECALHAACALDWRLEARKRLFIIGIALPHHHPGEFGVLLRTGTTCPCNVHWRAQLLRLEGQAIRVRAAIPPPPAHVAAVFGTTFLGMLHAEVWKEINGRRPADVLAPGLADQWSSDFIA